MRLLLLLLLVGVVCRKGSACVSSEIIDGSDLNDGTGEDGSNDSGDQAQQNTAEKIYYEYDVSWQWP